MSKQLSAFVAAVSHARRATILAKESSVASSAKLVYEKGWNFAFPHSNCFIDALGLPLPCEIHEFDLSSVLVNSGASVDSGFLMSYVRMGADNKHVIFVNANSNYCWKRFYVCKELIHILASSKSNTTKTHTEVISLLTQLVSSVPTFSDDAARIENAAYFGAMELLLSKEMVISILNANNGQVNIEDVSQQYRLPKLVVQARFSDNVVDIFNDIYSQSAYINAKFLPIMPHVRLI